MNAEAAYFLLGVVIGFVTTCFFYVRSSKQLQVGVNTLGSAFQNEFPNQDFKRDKKGNITGLNVTVGGELPRHYLHK